jgi:transcriptional regulator with XRE-family HTH domain
MDVAGRVNPPREGTKAERELIALISGRVRELRRERRLSLDGLSARAAVSKGMIVQIEKGQSNPSIATLCKVAAALGVSVADLVNVAGQQPIEVVPAGSPRLLWRGAKGGTATFLVGSRGPDMLELWIWQMRPGERYQAPAHPKGTLELLSVEKGALSIAFGDVSYVIGTGASALAHTDRPHAYACVGRKPVRFIMVVAEWHSRKR